ncbi:MAG TPA: GAF domain-containing sensor histidine kinase [Thermoleophilaceae bacterium]|jgi:signal transduction histidine kinase|nr:GAF domain-containing sensor histidine kinase [Thermoleophilaceae bacterium]
MSTGGASLARLQALVAEQAALRRVATFVAGNPDPGEVFARVCAEVGTVLGVKSTNLVRFQGSRIARVVGGWSVHGAPMFPVGEDVPLDGDTAVVKVSRSGRAERVDDYSELAGELPERIQAAGIASAVAAPIKVAGRLWGAIVASSGEPRSFGPGSEERVASFAELVSDALANADAREQLAASRARIVAAADSERRRLERNLHDGAQQRLVGLAIALREVEEELERDVDSARRVLASAREELALALQELRELARGIHPALLSDRGLGPALEALAARTPLPVEVVALPEARLPEAVEAAAYFVVAEGLTNVVKHAHATGVTVEITSANGCARVQVRDNGVGGATLEEGSGLRGLADRIEALGGSLEVHSANGDGTAVVAEIPLG